MLKYLCQYLYLVGLSIIITLMALRVGAEPFVVLEYRSSDSGGEEAVPAHPFRLDPDHSVQHRIRKDETLSHIIDNYYGGSAIDPAFIEMAIIRKNKTAFVRANPHYMFADKILHLPSLNEIKAMILKQKPGQHPPAHDSPYKGEHRDQIFFFG